jgi:hypothetical protein
MSTWRDEYGRAKVCQYKHHSGKDDEYYPCSNNQYYIGTNE